MKTDNMLDRGNFNKTKRVVTVGIFSAIAFVLQLLGGVAGLKVGGFLEIEISDVPALIVSMAYGPLAGVLTELIKNILHCTVSTTGFVGEFANFVVNSTLCVTAGLIYKYNKTFKTAVIALLAGTAAMAIMGIFSNLYIMLPLYMKGADFATKWNIVTSLILPFNVVRGLGISLITVLLYKRISKVIK